MPQGGFTGTVGAERARGDRRGLQGRPGSVVGRLCSYRREDVEVGRGSRASVGSLPSTSSPRWLHPQAWQVVLRVCQRSDLQVCCWSAHFGWMKASLVDLRRSPSRILDAVDKRETVILSRRGKPFAKITPLASETSGSVRSHPAFGMWGDADEDSVHGQVRQIRKGRFRDL